MNEKAFRLDFAIAIAALLVSAAAAFALIYQTRVIAQQYAATIWPYLSVDSSYGVHGVSIDVANDGLGPALIESAQLLIDGQPTPSWGRYMHDILTTPGLKPKPGQVSISSSSFGRSTAIRPGDTKSLFAITYKSLIDPHAFITHSVGLRLCYCSINSSCWDIVATPGKDNRAVPQ
ncbi:MAG: hypothetical protein WBD74_11045, partial [Candidatus Aquilonibacter sp.]